LLAVAPAQAATVYASTYNGPSDSKTGYGAVFAASTSEPPISGNFANASAFEFRRGVAVSALGRGAGQGGGTAWAEAYSTDSFYVNSNMDLAPLGGGVLLLTARIVANGVMTADRTPNRPGDDHGSAAFANYSYNWQVGDQTGLGGAEVRKFQDGSQDGYDNGKYDPGSALLFVRLGDVVNVSWRATAQASCGGGKACFAEADFSHTLRWGGVTDVQWLVGGVPQALPDGFQLTLTSADGEFDYMHEAFNPYLASATPEPGTWALAILGFGLAGAALRRRSATPLAS
jgi:hypothetical protein